MRKTPLVLSTVLLITGACMPAPEEHKASPEQPLADVLADAPPGAGFIESVDYMGTGCDNESAATSISPDGQAVTSSFSAFVAAAGPDEDPEIATRNCLMMMRVNVPSGWSYSLESIDIRGFVALEDDVTASRRSLYLISGSPVHRTPTARFESEISDDYNHPDVSPEAPGEWSPCGGGQVLWAATSTEVNNEDDEDAEGQLTVDSIDTELQWRRCQ